MNAVKGLLRASWDTNTRTRGAVRERGSPHLQILFPAGDILLSRRNWKRVHTCDPCASWTWSQRRRSPEPSAQRPGRARPAKRRRSSWLYSARRGAQKGSAGASEGNLGAVTETGESGGTLLRQSRSRGRSGFLSCLFSPLSRGAHEQTGIGGGGRAGGGYALG